VIGARQKLGSKVQTNLSDRPEGGSRLCARTLWAAALLMGGIVFGVLTAIKPLLLKLNTLLPVLCYLLAATASALLLRGVWSITAFRPEGRTKLSRALRRVIIRLLVPVAILIGQVIGISKQRLMLSFVQMNNDLTMNKHLAIKPEEILILLPQCLQAPECDRRLTSDIHNCRRCGKCDIAALLEIFDKRCVQAWVVPGGTLAREMVKTHRPRVILAVACERELSSGILDTHPIPVVSIINDRPNGPCVGTRVSCASVDEMLQRLLGKTYCAKDSKLVTAVGQHRTERKGQRESEASRRAS